MRFEDSYEADDADGPDGYDDPDAGTGLVTRIAQVAGAVVSVAFVLSIALWGWRLAVRDTGAIPVVRAVEGPMREAPDDPGGSAAAHQGLAVNSVPADGTVEAPPDRLVLAPSADSLAEEDQPVTPVALAPTPEDAPEADERPLSLIEALQVAEAEEAGLSVEQALALTANDEATPVPMMPVADLPPPSPDGAPVVSYPPRPRPVPASLSASDAADVPVTPVALVSTAPASGAQLVQLGAFTQAEDAQAAWTVLMVENADLLAVHTPLILPAENGGRQFFRLRVDGFDGLDDARRFCAALGARGAECVPVMAR